MNYNPFTLVGKAIFISGASSGIGRAIAIECSKLGAKVIITGRNEERLNKTYDALEGEGHIKFILDINEIDHILDFLLPLQNLDGIVHCAGITKTVPIQFITEEDLASIMKVNFFAPTLITKGLIKNNKIRKGGSVVFISSISGVYCSSPGGGLYSASKGAINGIVKTMALELANKSIRVNSVCPGMVHTNIYKEGIITEEQLKEDLKRYPLKRFGHPEEIAYAVVYLLSDASSWVTGSNLLIDGGYTLL
jgi:NAD(P)-dependent dehydrogenase (short-subunit alcohol dehydrogenase family)